jgi:hypothetical protein
MPGLFEDKQSLPTSVNIKSQTINIKKFDQFLQGQFVVKLRFGSLDY